MPVRANGVDMSMLELIESLEIIAGAHGVGRIDVVENRLAGIKEREVYEAPAAVVLHTAHRELEKLVIPRDLERVKHDLSRIYADIVYSGQWFSHDARDDRRVRRGGAAARHRRGASQTLQGRLPHRRAQVAVSSNSARPRHAVRRGASAGRLMAHLWSGRFEGSPDAALFEFGASFRFDRRLFEDDVTGQPRLGGRRFVRAGVLSQQEAAAIKAALDEILAPDPIRRSSTRRRPRTTRTCTRSSSGSWSQRVGDAGRRLHTGRSRNEQVALDLRLYLKRRVPLIQQRDQGARGGSARPGGRVRRCGHAVLHAPAPRAANPRVAFLPRPRLGAAPRSCAVRVPAERDRRAAARLGGDRRDQLSDRRPCACRSARILAHRRQQHRRHGRAGLRRRRSCTPRR